MTSAKELLRQSIDVIKEHVGNEWLEKHDQQWKEYAWKHPIVSTYHFAKTSLEKDDTAIINNEHATRLIFWAYNLSTVRSRINTNALRRHLRDPGRCEKTLYEIQVASFYLTQGYEVEFNDEAPSGYDFHVVCSDGIVPIECKKKGESERDQKAGRNWKELARRLNSVMDQRKRAAFVWIESAVDLTEEDIAFLEEQVESMIVLASNNVQEGKALFYAVSNVTKDGVYPTEEVGEQLGLGDRFFLVIQEVRPSDEIQRGSFNRVFIFYDQPSWGVGTVQKPREFKNGYAIGPVWQGVPQYADISCQLKAINESTREVSNFRALGFKSREERDYTKTVLNSLTEVRNKRQLPPEGPGLVFIDIAVPSLLNTSGPDPLTLRFDEIGKMLAPQLQGEQNKRVNAVVLTCGMSTKVIEHKNPRKSLPSGFHPLGKVNRDNLE